MANQLKAIRRLPQLNPLRSISSKYLTGQAPVESAKGWPQSGIQLGRRRLHRFLGSKLKAPQLNPAVRQVRYAKFNGAGKAQRGPHIAQITQIKTGGLKNLQIFLGLLF